jgi:hypothetical protein
MPFWAFVMNIEGGKVLEFEVDHSELRNTLTTLPLVYAWSDDNGHVRMKTPERDILEEGLASLWSVFREAGAVNYEEGTAILAYLNFCKQERRRVRLTESYNFTFDIDTYIDTLHRLFTVLLQCDTHIFAFEFSSRPR